MIIALTENSREYANIIFHIIRIFIPTLTWDDFLNNTSDKAILLEIKVNNEKIYCTLKDNCSFKFDINDGNGEINKAVKIGVYKLLASFLKYKNSPWGILTGIRPTKIVHRLWDQGLNTAEIYSVLKKEYLLSDEKIENLIEITSFQRNNLLIHKEAKVNVSIYISIPFCPSKCSYCSFPSYIISKWENKLETYLDCLIKEIIQVGEALKNNNIVVQTVYIGGGTPSVLTHKQLNRLLKVINSALITNKTIEFTLEAGRPDTIDKKKLEILKELGVNRISINPQTMVDKTLNEIGRNHTSNEVIEIFRLAKKIGFEIINMDIILGLPGEDIDSLRYTLDEISKLRPNNVTVHVLSLKRSSKYDLGLLENSNENLIAEMLEVTKQKMYDNGLIPYYLYRQRQMIANLENIGYCEYDYPCIYNIQMIEERQTIWGLGVGATSKVLLNDEYALENQNNPKDLFYYIENIDEVITEKVKAIYKLYRREIK
ncbi:oxygen-independent coproporphyrinogen-3 oxidase [Desulfonispora thiosulfatigenes DSM 11270]|uniref:Oxygen-independent coproporphyrinogen-3 oxidase n=1 Tax=Desulfonispora thiosulfatigenes DSM 11270 TaxID=656914 RepID=A0A1W1VR18_DESTI|nr:coproporphyrinogen dehydrogenase HemZ [Desulfonispora thiosulfatigenes]SMB95670.1 oxygen-independent coproporphyrinogen-3 oxidase [Desulfonispora thiosulfatigenes DSM 11270]